MVIPAKGIRPIRITRGIQLFTNQWITAPHLPPGDLFHATLNATSFIMNNSKYSYNDEIGKPSGSLINSNITLYILLFPNIYRLITIQVVFALISQIIFEFYLKNFLLQVSLNTSSS